MRVDTATAEKCSKVLLLFSEGNLPFRPLGAGRVFMEGSWISLSSSQTDGI